MPEREQCSATTAKGARCKRLAVEGADLCAVHMGAPVGRPAKLEEQVVARMVEILKMGGYVEAAAAAAGVSKATFYGWLERGDPEGTTPADEPFRDFRLRIDQARAEGESRNVMLVARAGMKDWRAAAWMLERQFPDRWGGPQSRVLAGASSPDDPSAPTGATTVESGWTDDQRGPDGRPL